MADQQHSMPDSSAPDDADILSGPPENDDATRQEAHALIAHELRAPLTVIKGYLEILERPMDEEMRLSALAAANRATDRLATMLDDLLAASADSRVFAPRHREQTNLLELCESVADELRPLHDHVIDVGGVDDIASCDRRLMWQLLTNLIQNALKHTPSDGAVRVTVSAGDNVVLVRVEDEGPGVAPESRERVFELFARLGTPEELPEGLGLGLPVSRAIAEQHGGSLGLVDGSGGGACFELQIPRDR